MSKLKRLRPISSLSKKLWKIFSEYVRRKNADDNGMVECISCGSLKHWKEIHAGHYHASSVSLALRFDEENVHSQCAGCNTFRHGNMAQYALALRKKYGEGILEQLDLRKHSIQKFSRNDYEDMINKYKKKLLELGS